MIKIDIHAMPYPGIACDNVRFIKTKSGEVSSEVAFDIYYKLLRLPYDPPGSYGIRVVLAEPHTIAITVGDMHYLDVEELDTLSNHSGVMYIYSFRGDPDSRIFIAMSGLASTLMNRYNTPAMRMREDLQETLYS